MQLRREINTKGLWKILIYIPAMVMFDGCSKKQEDVLSEMSKEVVLKHKDFVVAIDLLSAMRNLEYLKYDRETGEYSLWFMRDSSSIEEYYGLDLKSLLRLKAIKENGIHEDQIKQMKELLIKLNCISVKRYLRINRDSRPFGSTEFLHRTTGSGGYFFHFYKVKVDLVDIQKFEKLVAGSFVDDSTAVYFK